MGLDMYAYARKGELPTPVDFDAMESDELIATWRKHPNLHGWMERLYRSKNGADAQFNCVPVALTSDDIDALEKAVNDEDLPDTSGFFFGKSFPEDKADDLAFIQKARAAFAEGKSVFYTSWW